MGGDIKIVKKEGPGTLLRFYLMFGQPHDSEPDTPRISLPAEFRAVFANDSWFCILCAPGAACNEGRGE
jgi:hypothetical protein